MVHRVVRILNMNQEPGTGKAGYIMECSRGRPAGKVAYNSQASASYEYK